MEQPADRDTLDGRLRATPEGSFRSDFELERDQLEQAIARAWARVEAANHAHPDPAAQMLVAEAESEVERLAEARDRRLRSLDAAADLAMRTDVGRSGSSKAAHFASDSATDVAGLVADDLAEDEQVREFTRFPLRTVDAAR